MMGWTDVTYKCGCDDRVQMYGPRRERDRKAAAAGRYDCTACRVAASNERAENDGIPALTGSEKQISWASDIRDTWMQESNDTLTSLQSRGADGAVRFEAARDAIAARRTDAREWIDMRGHSALDEVTEIFKKEKSL